MNRARPGIARFGWLALAWGLTAGCTSSTSAGDAKPKPPVGAVRIDPNAPPPDEEPADEPAPAGTFHRVDKGETLWAIARAYNLPVEDLVEVNGLENPDVLTVGQLIFIPDDDGLGLPHETKAVEAKAPRRRAKEAGDLEWPLAEGVILRDFDPSDAVPHDGLLLAAPRGTPVLAANAGEVLFEGDEGTTLGRMVILRHESGLLTIYAHLDRALVKRGERVMQGHPIGTVGSSGRTQTPQLHFQVRQGRTAENPLDHLPPP